MTATLVGQSDGQAVAAIARIAYVGNHGHSGCAGCCGCGLVGIDIAVGTNQLTNVFGSGFSSNFASVLLYFNLLELVAGGGFEFDLGACSYLFNLTSVQLLGCGGCATNGYSCIANRC